MGRQVELFDLPRQAVPSWAVREMWVGEPELIEFIAAGTVLCDICGRPVGFDDLDRFPVEDKHLGAGIVGRLGGGSEDGASGGAV